MSQPEKRKYPLRNSSNKKSKNVLNKSTKVNANHNITTKPTLVQEIISKIGQPNSNRKNNVSNVNGSFSPINIYDSIEFGEVLVHNESNNASNNSSIKISENNNNNNNNNDGCIYFYLFIFYYYLFLDTINNCGQNYLGKAKLALKRLQPLSLTQILIESSIVIIYTILSI